MRRLALLSIRFYQSAISVYSPPSCRFVPSCSQYGHEAIEKHGVMKGGWLVTKRFLRCHPWNEGGVDFVP
ncbi:MAG: membrane protein insertion efficiency factor YidD [Dehalococcoidia bacterium]